MAPPMENTEADVERGGGMDVTESVSEWEAGQKKKAKCNDVVMLPKIRND